MSVGGFFALIVVVALTSCAGDAEPGEVASRVSQELMSPFCDGLTIHDCPSQQSEELRFEILEMAHRGMSDTAIVDELVSRYGERIRGVPEPAGTGLLVWLLPGMVLAAGSAGAFVLSKRFSRRSSEAPEQLGPAPSVEERARLEAELAAARERS